MQDTDITFAARPPASRTDEVRGTLPHFPKERIPVAGSGNAANRPGLMQRILSFLTGLLHPKAARRKELLETVVTEKTTAAGHNASVVFRGHTASTLVTPLGTYAGKSTSIDLRKAAEKQFHAMQSSDGATIN